MKKDKYGHLVEDDGARITDPYGSLEFAVGSNRDFICFDYHFTEDKCILHAVLNSETGSFIQDFDYEVTGADDSPYTSALRIVKAALDWCGENDVRHSKKSWNQDPFYFVRAVKRAFLRHNGLFGNDSRDASFSVREIRMGGRRINAWAGIK